MQILCSTVGPTPATAQETAIAAPTVTAKPTLLRAVDLSLGESADVTLSDGKQATIKLVSLQEARDDLRDAVRRAEVTVEVNGQRTTLVSATYHLPTTVAGVRIDCPITMVITPTPATTRGDW